MPYPYSDPNWASDANFSSGAESGNPTKVNPGAGPLAQGYVPGERFKGQRSNYILNLLASWITGYLKDLHNQVEFLNKNYAFTGAHSGSYTVDTSGSVEASAFSLDHGSNEYAYKAARTQTIWIPSSDFVLGGSGASHVSATSLQFTSTSDFAACSLQKFLPSGSVITGVDARLDQNTGVSAVAMRMQITRTVVDPIAPFSDTVTTPADVSLGTGVSGDNLLSASFTSVAIAKSSDKWTVTITPSDAVTGGDPEVFKGIHIAFQDPGPRNF